MGKETNRLSVTLLPEWEEDIRKLKKEMFYDKSKSELIRFLIQTGLNESKKQNKNICPQKTA